MRSTPNKPRTPKAAENAEPKQRASQLAEDNRGLEQRRQAARSSNRFLDKCLADLEAELLDTQLNQERLNS